MATPTDDQTDIHTYFGLSYATHLVLPRTLLQSMPLTWQWKFVALLQQYDQAFEHVEQPQSYSVQAGEERTVEALTDVELKQLDISRTKLQSADGIEYTYYGANGDELPPGIRVLVPRPDPLPHYNRGRTHVEPLLPNCLHCDSPASAVHGPDCPNDDQ